MALEITAEELSQNPAWHLYDLDLQRGELRFLEARPETFRISAFLDTRIAYAGEQVFGFPLEAVAGALRQRPPPRRDLALLFHTSFCCSSLLARSLQRERRMLVLREPWVLRRLGDLKRSVQSRAQAWYPQGPALLDMALQLLGKTWEDTEAVLIKPTNVSNNLAEDILSLRPEASGLVLTSDLESFLVSNLKKTEETRRKLPALVELFDHDVRYGEQLDISLARLDFLQAVAVVWHAQRLQWQALLASSAGARLRTLDAAALLARPAETISAVAAFLGRPLSAADAAEVVAGPVWSTHAKDPFSSYDSGHRGRENRETLERHRLDIDATLRWAEPLLARRPPELTRPLVS